MARKLFSTFTVLLVVLCAWTAYANVFSDDAGVRALARSTVDQAAGCGDDCKLEGLRGDRGMFEERIEYDIVKRGRFVVVCRRAFIVAGDHGCDVTERPATAPTASAHP
ncbi:MAG: hypothetical protein KF850_38765 [Labilithrix sp.]|nr:hypothetical protein [Labilithrix sp.]